MNAIKSIGQHFLATGHLLRRRMTILMAVFGPGIISALADNDAGGVATYSVLASKFGYSMLFILLLLTVLLAITQEIGARISIVTGRGFGDLIRERYGIRISVLTFLLLCIANMGTTVANFAGLTAGFSLFHWPKIPALIIFVILMIIFVAKGNYLTNQRIFLGVGILYLVYVVSAFLSRPEWDVAFTNLLTPVGIEFSPEYVFGAIALLGTTVTPWGQFFISSFVLDKKLTIDKLKYEKLETFFGAFLTNFFSFFMMIAVAATLYINKIEIKTAQEAALVITPFAGQFASTLFGIGLITASYMGAVIVPLTTAYAFSEFFGVEGSLDLPFSKSRFFYGLFLMQIILAALLVMIPGISLFKIVLYTQSLNGLLLPVIIFFLLKFASDSQLMGKHINNRFYNYFAVSAAVMIIASSIFILISGILGLA